jgi:AcrR family transcriptional regulator
MPRIKAQTDEALLEIALEVIRVKGPTEFTLSDISKSAQLSPATLLQRFGSKDKLLVSAISYANKKMQERFHLVVSQAQGSHSNPMEVLIEILIGLIEGTETPEQIAAGLDILKKDILEQDLNKVSVEHFLIRRQLLENLLLQAQAQKIIKAEAPTKTLAHGLDSIWQGTILLWAIEKSGVLNTLIRTNLMLLLNGYLEKN